MTLLLTPTYSCRPISFAPAAARQEPALVPPGSDRNAPSPDLIALETPLFFNSGGRPLYGVYHAPAAVRAGAPVLVQCHSLGVEQIALYRAEVLNARAVAATGIPVLRYHARGHGDSSGDFSAVTFAGLVDDARTAADEARRRSQCSDVAWLGVRFGGLVAARALGLDGAARALALWEPTHRPADYFRGQLRGLLFSQVAEGRRPDATVDQLLERLERESRIDVHGYFLHRTVVESSRGENLSQALASWTGPTMIAQLGNRKGLAPVTAGLVGELEARGARVETTCIRDEPGWHFTQNPAWENAALVRATAEWLDAVA